MARTLTKPVARRQEQTFADWFAELKELAGERWPDVADQAPTVYAVWGGGATPQQALYMVGLILPPTGHAPPRTHSGGGRSESPRGDK
jgi:hypothetical protein